MLDSDPLEIKSTIFEDNNGALAVTTSPKMSPRTKHIAVKYLFVKDYFSHDSIESHPFVLQNIDTHEQKADIFTKGLPVHTFKVIRHLLCGY